MPRGGLWEPSDCIVSFHLFSLQGEIWSPLSLVPFFGPLFCSQTGGKSWVDGWWDSVVGHWGSRCGIHHLTIFGLFYFQNLRALPTDMSDRKGETGGGCCDGGCIGLSNTWIWWVHQFEIQFLEKVTACRMTTISLSTKNSASLCDHSIFMKNVS